jgi:transposase
VKGRPGIAPGLYFLALLIGDCEGISSERGISWRLTGRVSLPEFLGFNPGDQTPDHSTLSRTRRRLPMDTRRVVFRWFVFVLCAKGVLNGQTVGNDAAKLRCGAW